MNDLEITLEANLGTVDAARFEAIRSAGINRLSMGVQAAERCAICNSSGRGHGVAEARNAWRTCREDFSAGVVRSDLCAAADRPSRRGRIELNAEALARGARRKASRHLSLYQLTMEENTPMAADHARGAFRAAGSKTMPRRLYERTQALCATRCRVFRLTRFPTTPRTGWTALPDTTSPTGAAAIMSVSAPGAHGRLTIDGATRADARPGKSKRRRSG